MTNLLASGNSKLSKKIKSFSLPRCVTCPGSSGLCRKACYVKGFARYGLDYTPRLKASRDPGFVDRMVAEASKVPIVRIHVSGDWYDVAYVRKWIQIVEACPGTVFYCYTKSWRIPAIRRELLRLQALPNIMVNWSCDRETGIPDYKHVMYMSVDDDDAPATPVKLVFRVKRRTVKHRMGGTPVCPNENGLPPKITCDKCGRCF